MKKYTKLNYKKRFNSLCSYPYGTIKSRNEYFIVFGTLELQRAFKSEIRNIEFEINFIQSQILRSKDYESVSLSKRNLIG